MVIDTRCITYTYKLKNIYKIYSHFHIVVYIAMTCAHPDIKVQTTKSTKQNDFSLVSRRSTRKNRSNLYPPLSKPRHQGKHKSLLHTPLES